MKDIDFDKLIEPFIKIYQDLEHDLVVKIATHFKLYEDIGFENSMKWYAKKVEELGGLNQETINIISKQTNIPKKKIVEMLKKAGISTLNLEDIQKANEKGIFNVDIDKLINSNAFKDIVNNSYKEIDGIFKLIHTKAMESTSQTYMDVLNRAYTDVRSGLDYNTSIRNALTKMSNEGIKVVSYKQKDGSIRRYGIESCVRRDVLTAIVQATNRSSDNFCKEAGYEYFIVSKHLGARVTDTHDYKDHAWWQGKVYKIDGSTKEYPNFQETCNEGDVQGFGGANCRHIKFGYIPGISVPSVNNIDEEENARVYALNQTQRAYENKIKNYKTQIDVAKASEDNEKVTQYKNKLKEVDKEYNDFCKENDLKRKYGREYVINNDYKIPTFEDEYFKEFNTLDKNKEHLIYYDLNTGEMVGNITTGNSHNVQLNYKTRLKTMFAKKDSLIAVHNHPSNASFSLTDFQTFNNSKELFGIAVRTDDYIYLLSNGKGSKLKATQENMVYMKKIFDKIEADMNITKENKTIDLVHERNKMFAKEMGWKYERIRNKEEI